MSRDLYTWERVADRAIFIGIDPWDGIAYDTCQVSVCGAPIVRDNEIWIYYEAARFRGLAEIYPKEYEPYFKDYGALSLAKLRLDGFVSLGTFDQGTVLTKPFQANGGTIHVNMDAPNGLFTTEIVDAETMEPLATMSTDNCNPLSGDFLNAMVSWVNITQLPSSQPVRARFHLRNANLYAFWIEKFS